MRAAAGLGWGVGSFIGYRARLVFGLALDHARTTFFNPKPDVQKHPLGYGQLREKQQLKAEEGTFGSEEN
jgi:hypothetical protein